MVAIVAPCSAALQRGPGEGSFAGRAIQSSAEPEPPSAGGYICICRWAESLLHLSE